MPPFELCAFEVATIKIYIYCPYLTEISACQGGPVKRGIRKASISKNTILAVHIVERCVDKVGTRQICATEIGECEPGVVKLCILQISLGRDDEGSVAVRPKPGQHR